MSQFHIIDPRKNFPHHFDFSGIHYFHLPSWMSKEDEYFWLIWTEEMIETHGLIEVQGMIELQRNPYDDTQIWLKFFEVAPKFQGNGFSKQMINIVAEVFKQYFENKVLVRSRPSKSGEIKLKVNLSNALDIAKIPYQFSI